MTAFKLKSEAGFTVYTRTTMQMLRKGRGAYDAEGFLFIVDENGDLLGVFPLRNLSALIPIRVAIEE